MSEVLPSLNNIFVTTPNQGRQRLARRYRREANHAVLLMSVLVGIFLGALAIPSVTIGLRNWAVSLSADPAAVVGLYVLVVVTAVLLISLPGIYASQYAIPRKYGLVRMSAKGWWIKYAKSVGFTLAEVLVIAEVVYWIIRATTAWWWLVVAILWWCTILLPQYAWPLSRFGKKKLVRLDDPQLALRLAQLMERAGAPAISVWVLPVRKNSKGVNAYYLGIGRARRIVLTDTMLESFNYDEIEAIVAHELAHCMNSDIPKRLVGHGVSILATTIFASLLIALYDSVKPMGGVANVATLPYLVGVCALRTWWLPAITGARSRNAERKADRYAIDLTGKPDAFKSAMIKLAESNLIETQPAKYPGVGATHPVMGERMALAEAAARRGLRTATRPALTGRAAGSGRIRRISIAAYHSTRKV